MNTNKIINSTIASLFVVLITFLAIVFLVKINVYESYLFQKQDETIYLNLDKNAELVKFIEKKKAKYLIGYYKNNANALKFIIEDSDNNGLIKISNQSIDENIGTISFYLGKTHLYDHLIKSVNL
ncbi:hypothetical protein [[Mycoplasma] imitans]|uniref:hypothetical protein n=1 Tax=[Mycoplasma] imitans TaxID=29560 RepID=UPI0004B8721D|nr:hypothetical protein [[Mycoplasma] imitans]